MFRSSGNKTRRPGVLLSPFFHGTMPEKEKMREKKKTLTEDESGFYLMDCATDRVSDRFRSFLETFEETCAFFVRLIEKFDKGD